MVTLSPACVRLLCILAATPPRQLAKRPTQILAHGLGVTTQAVSCLVASLRSAGLVETRRGEIRLLAAPVEVHHHPPGYDCSRQCKPLEVCHMASTLADGLKNVVKVYSGDARKTRSPTQEPSDVLVATYVALRRRIDPLFDLGPKARSRLLACESALRAARIPKDRWGAYLAWAFEEFRRMTGGKLAFAPLDRLASDAIIDRFAATLPARKLNGVKAKAMLRAHGFTGSITAALEIARAIRDGRKPPGYSFEAQEAGAWLAERLDEVGTVEVVE